MRGCDELRDVLLEYALATAASEDADAVERHLARCADCRRELDETVRLYGTLQDEGAGAGRERVWRRVAERIGSESCGSRPDAEDVQRWKSWQPGGGLQTARDAEWEPTAVEGIEARRLYVSADRKRATMLIRMAPGTSYPAHRHGGTEQCYVLSGDLRHGERVMRAGDFEVVEEGSVHEVQSTKEGCTLLILSSLEDELL